MARTHQARRTLTSNSALKVLGVGQRYQPKVDYGNSLIMRPGRYNISFKTDPRFPVLDETGHPVAVPADHRTDASRRGGDRRGINHGAGIPTRSIL